MKKEKKKKKKRIWKKPIFLFFLFISMVIAAAAIYLFYNLNMIAKRAIEKYGSLATLTRVRVKNVDISIKEGTCEINNFSISNSKGFKKKKSFQTEKIHVDLDILSLKDDMMIVNKIIITRPEVFVEINERNKNNLIILKNNLSKAIALTSENTPVNQKEPKLNIRYIFIKGGEIYVHITPLKNKSYQLKLPSIQMRNLRGTSTEISNQILNKMINITLKEVKKQGIRLLKARYGDRVKKELEKQKTNILDKLKKGLKIE